MNNICCCLGLGVLAVVLSSSEKDKEKLKAENTYLKKKIERLELEKLEAEKRGDWVKVGEIAVKIAEIAAKCFSK